MLIFVPNKHSLQEALLFCFHLKNSVAVILCLLSEAYEDYVPSISTCEYWFDDLKVGILIWKTRSALVNRKNLKTKNRKYC